MKRFRKYLEEKGLTQEALNIVLGIVILIALVTYGITGSVLSLFAVIFVGAMMNITTGLSYVRKNEKRTLGMSMILLGVVIIMIFGVYITMSF